MYSCRNCHGPWVTFAYVRERTVVREEGTCSQPCGAAWTELGTHTGLVGFRGSKYPEITLGLVVELFLITVLGAQPAPLLGSDRRAGITCCGDLTHGKRR